jgi:hypothetical protein
LAAGLGQHIIESLIDAEFDVAHSRMLKPDQGMGHAFSFVHRQHPPPVYLCCEV